jgi:hypothetical protein
MSGYHDDIIVHHGFLEPGTQLLQKPFLEDDLLRAMRKIIDGPPSTMTLEGPVPSSR